MRSLATVFAAPVMLAACSASPTDPAPVATETALADSGEKPDLLLFTSLPIYWSEGGLGDMLSADAPVHWARTALEARYDLVPVDTLTSLPANGTLLMAQPRALSAEENVALDDHVRGGGRVVLIVDPMLDAHSAYGLGDRRRPEAISMLSPILARWGLRLVPDGREAYEAQWGSRTFAVEEGGRFELASGGHDSVCHLVDDALIARCNVGNGKVMLLGDATFLAHGENAGADGAGLLADLIAAAETPPSAP
ncbi:Gldg family protein [Croceicoccus bisphenolivorans]|uniref:Gldg family protein n=1 Tax=Croceicoccus bisphenolivorans TaxID=1783232 RepID=UPI0012E97724|nr:DUF4350 domain-containing protein [Croceicoccus bisphenolivorans]